MTPFFLHSDYHLHQQPSLQTSPTLLVHVFTFHLDCFLSGLSPSLAFLNSSLYTATERDYSKTQIPPCDFPTTNLSVAPFLVHKALHYLTGASFLLLLSDFWAPCSSQSTFGSLAVSPSLIGKALLVGVPFSPFFLPSLLFPHLLHSAGS